MRSVFILKKVGNGEFVESAWFNGLLEAFWWFTRGALEKLFLGICSCYELRSEAHQTSDDT